MKRAGRRCPVSSGKIDDGSNRETPSCLSSHHQQRRSAGLDYGGRTSNPTATVGGAVALERPARTPADRGVRGYPSLRIEGNEPRWKQTLPTCKHYARSGIDCQEDFLRVDLSAVITPRDRVRYPSRFSGSVRKLARQPLDMRVQRCRWHVL